MGQYFKIFNVNKNECAKPFTANWKNGEYNIDHVMKQLGWSESDIIFAVGDYGSIIPHYNATEIFDKYDRRSPEDFDLWEKYFPNKPTLKHAYGWLN